MKEKNHHLSVCSFGFALGIIWGITVLLIGWFSMLGWSELFVETLGSVYIGYESSFVGGILGGIWGFFCAWIGGAVFSLLYNWICCCRCGCCRKNHAGEQ